MKLQDIERKESAIQVHVYWPKKTYHENQTFDHINIHIL